MAFKARYAIKTKLPSLDNALNTTLTHSSFNYLLSTRREENMETTSKVTVQIRMGKNLHYCAEKLKQKIPIQTFPFGFYLKYLKSETKLHQRILNYFKPIDKEIENIAQLDKYLILDENSTYHIPEFYFQNTSVFASFLKDFSVGVQFFNIPTKSTIQVKELVLISESY